MALNNRFYFSSPVEVVKVTPKNLEEVAEWCGGKVHKVESRRVKGRVDSYVWVPTPKGAAISWAFPGMFITRRLAVTEKNELKGTFSVFRKDYFSKNYFSDVADAVDQTWERLEREKLQIPVVEVAELVDTLTADEVVEAGNLLRAHFGLAPGHEVVKIDPKTQTEEVWIESDGINPVFSALPDSPVEQRAAIHEDAVEAAAEAS